MKLANEVFELLFCSSSRPKYCIANKNICCVKCEYLEQCLEKNKNSNSKILPCRSLEFYDEQQEETCEFLV